MKDFYIYQRNKIFFSGFKKYFSVFSYHIIRAQKDDVILNQIQYETISIQLNTIEYMYFKKLTLQNKQTLTLFVAVATVEPISAGSIWKKFYRKIQNIFQV